ncbi:MAG: hypothetical protein WCO69_00335 [Candidatus Omnitrophota bacterium]
MKHQLEGFLTVAARSGLKQIDKKSPLAKELKGLDVEALLTNDIHLICEAVTFPEMMKIMALVAKVKVDPDHAVKSKEDIKGMARAVVARIEKTGKLKTPPSCRELLFNL